MLVFIFRWVKSAEGNNARDQHRLRQIYSHKKRKKQLSGLNAGTIFYLPRRVTVYLWIRCFGGRWNPVCEYMHWSTGEEEEATDRQEPLVTTAWKWWPVLFAPLPPPLLYDHHCVDMKQKQTRCDVWTECHLAQIKRHVYFILWSFSNVCLFAKLLTNLI